LGPVSFVMVLIGCTQGNACKPVMTMPAAYRTEEACLADTADIVAAISRPGNRLSAECRKRANQGQTSAPVRGSGRQKPLA